MIKNIHKKQQAGGFTLIEMAIVMVIGGITISLMSTVLLTYVKKSRVSKTEVRIEAIQEALSQYLTVNRRYPCVARRDIAPGETPTGATAAFGREVSADCTAGAIGGTARSGAVTRPGVGTDRVRTGSVPTRTLNLPDEYAFDGWGRRFTYAVTERQASVGVGGTLYGNDGGFISIVDSTNTVFVSNAHYALVSHGSTGDGGFSFSGNTVAPCSGTTLDRENCNDDARFMITLVNSEVMGANFFDDYIYYQGQTAPPLLIPTGAVMAFDLTTCPDGWENYNLAEGKFVIGANNGVAPNPPTSFTNYRTNIPFDSNANGIDNTNTDVPIQPYASGNTTTVNLNSGVGNSAQPNSALIPPYVALLYCKKLPQ